MALYDAVRWIKLRKQLDAAGEISFVSCKAAQRLDLPRLAWRDDTRHLADGGYEVGRWYWWADVNQIGRAHV